MPTRSTETGRGEPWYREGLRFECTLCGNCCTGPEGVVLFTPEEGRAMAAKLGMPEAEFLAAYTRRIAGSQRSLNEKHTSFGNDCVFLDRESLPGKAVCALYEARPSQCRTWPFWEGNLRSRKAWEATKRHVPCPGMDQGPVHSLQQIRIALDADRAQGGSQAR
jgi:Fe-S-cluster containining protein